MVFSRITGVNLDLICRMKNILSAVCSGYHLDQKKFRPYCDHTLQLIVEQYGWYVMPPTVHKLLLHGSQIADILELPIGQYSEEAQETQHKELRKARLNHSCKISWLNVMKNQYHYMLIRSDPSISSHSFIKHKTSNGSPLSEEVEDLLMK